MLGSNVRNRKNGTMIYSLNGRASTPFAGGILCLAPPQRRTPPINSGGSLVGSDCTGAYSFDFCAWNASGLAPFVPPGTTVDAQYYSRDPGYAPPNDVGLTNALEFTMVP